MLTTRTAKTGARRPLTRFGRTGLALVTAAALGTGASLAAAAPASAADRQVESGSVGWGLKQSFRSYVGSQLGALPPIGALPAGQRITVLAPAAFDTAAPPASAANTATPNETLPYTLPAQTGTVTDATHFSVRTAGGFAYHFPSHKFDVTVSNVTVEVTGSTGLVKADVAAVVTGDFGDWHAGTYGGPGIALATIDNPGATLTGSTLSMNATGIRLTEAGAAALPLYPAGEALDNLTLTATVAADVPTPTWTPQLTVSKQSGFNPDGSETVTVTGSGFDPGANVSTRPPVTVGAPTGVYVVFGKFASTWRPSEAAPSSARKVIDQKWALPAASKNQVAGQYPNQAPSLVEISADGTFTATLAVTPDEASPGVYGIYTYAAGGAAANAAQELAIPISFTSSDPGGSTSGDLSLDVTVPTTPTDPEPGEFLWRIDGGVSAISLGTAARSGDHFAATGQLAPIVVTDTRAGGSPWSISATVSDFAGGGQSFGGKHLGWSPTVSLAGAGATAGASVASGFVTGSGLATARTLGSADAGHPLGSATLGAALDLRLPLETPAGTYTGTLTLTAIG